MIRRLVLVITTLFLLSKFCISLKVKNLILYDGVCKFCNTWVGVLLKLDKSGKFKYAALQSPSGKKALSLCNRSVNDLSSIVYIDDELDLNKTPIDSVKKSNLKFYTKSEAIIQIVKKLGIPIQFVTYFLPRILKDGFYDIVAQNRYSLMGKYDECKLYDIEYEDRFLK